MNTKNIIPKLILIILICIILNGCAYQEIKVIKPDKTIIESKVWSFGTPIIY